MLNIGEMLLWKPPRRLLSLFYFVNPFFPRFSFVLGSFARSVQFGTSSTKFQKSSANTREKW